jgi:hypothetical protein
MTYQGSVNFEFYAPLVRHSLLLFVPSSRFIKFFFIVALVALAMEVPYPPMQRTPPDQRFIVPGGSLLYHPNRDGRHPYFYDVQNHPLDKRMGKFKGRTLVCILDTDPTQMDELIKFEESLCIPLGPDHTIPAMGK